jgi:hypothetical protein
LHPGVSLCGFEFWTPMTNEKTLFNIEIDDLLSTLKAKKRKLEATDQQVELEVLLDFLRNTRTEKEEASGTDRCMHSEIFY